MMLKLKHMAAAILAVLPLTGAPSSAAPGGGYAAGVLDATHVVAPAPTASDSRGDSDRRIFRATRALAGTPRWAMAVSDIREDPASMLANFSCSAGIALTLANAPHTAALIERAARDTAAASNRAKDVYKRARPFMLDEGPLCQSVAEASQNYDYPSGHSTRGWTWALLLADLLPGRAGPLLARGRSFGESRIVCGVHNASAVEAGRISAAYGLAAIGDRPAFRRDFDAARRELARLGRDSRSNRPDAGACAAEERLVAQPIY